MSARAKRAMSAAVLTVPPAGLPGTSGKPVNGAGASRGGSPGPDIRDRRGAVSGPAATAERVMPSGPKIFSRR